MLTLNSKNNSADAPINAEVKFLNNQSPGGSSSGESKLHTQLLEMAAKDAPEFLNITEAVKKVIATSKIKHGSVLIYSMHTTAAIIINEHEPLLLRDLVCSLDRWAPKDNYYRHNDFPVRTVNMHEGECPNGHSHCQHAVLGASETVPIFNGKMLLGEFQSIFMVELDEPKPRNVCVQVRGI